MQVLPSDEECKSNFNSTSIGDKNRLKPIEFTLKPNLTQSNFNMSIWSIIGIFGFICLVTIIPDLVKNFPYCNSSGSPVHLLPSDNGGSGNKSQDNLMGHDNTTLDTPDAEFNPLVDSTDQQQIIGGGARPRTTTPRREGNSIVEDFQRAEDFGLSLIHI